MYRFVQFFGQLRRRLDAGDRSWATAVWAAILLAVILGLQVLGGWYVVWLARISKEEELKTHLSDLGRLSQTMLSAPVSQLAELEEYAMWGADRGGLDDDIPVPPDPQLFRLGLDAFLTTPLRRFAEEARLDRVVVISRAGRVLYDTARPDDILARFDYWEVDERDILLALRGNPTASPVYVTQDAATMRYYAPVALPTLTMNERGEIVTSSSAEYTLQPRALICLVAGLDYLEGIQELSAALRRAGLAMTLLIGLIGLVIHRLLARQSRIERQAAEAERLAAVGQLAAGFAHELRNPLGIIRAFTEDLEHGLRRSPAPPETLEACREIVEEIERMNRLVGQFLDYSRGEDAPGTPAASRVGEVIHSVLSVLRPAAEQHGMSIEPVFEGLEPPERMIVSIEPSQLKQILMNLLLNAIDHSPEGGRLWVEVEGEPRRVILRVRDEGSGVTPEDARRIFEPFYTTRPGGAGLGLAVSRRLAVAAGGMLELEAGGRPGAVFRVTLPRTTETPAAPATGGPAAMAAATHER